MTTEPKPTSVRLDADTKAALADAAKKEDRSISWLIEQAVKEYLRKRGFLPPITD